MFKIEWTATESIYTCILMFGHFWWLCQRKFLICTDIVDVILLNDENNLFPIILNEYLEDGHQQSLVVTSITQNFTAYSF